MRHKHDFVEQERFSTDRVELSGVRGFRPSDLERLTLGVTTILYRCPSCRAIKTLEILGSSQVQ